MLIGESIGPFQILGKLGEGGMGEGSELVTWRRGIY